MKEIGVYYYYYRSEFHKMNRGKTSKDQRNQKIQSPTNALKRCGKRRISI